MRKRKWTTRGKVYLNGVLTQRNKKIENLGRIYSKSLTNNDSTIRMSNESNGELQTVKRDNNKY